MADFLTIEDKLGIDKFNVDENSSHIKVDKASTDVEEIRRVVRACPAGLYKLDESGKLLFDHLGCLECGTCRLVSGGKVVEDWRHPAGGFGISFRMG